jgi:hypothetical protein
MSNSAGVSSVCMTGDRFIAQLSHSAFGIRTLVYQLVQQHISFVLAVRQFNSLAMGTSSTVVVSPREF